MELNFPHENRVQIKSFESDCRHVILKKNRQHNVFTAENGFLNASSWFKVLWQKIWNLLKHTLQKNSSTHSRNPYRRDWPRQIKSSRMKSPRFLQPAFSQPPPISAICILTNPKTVCHSRPGGSSCHTGVSGQGKRHRYLASFLSNSQFLPLTSWSCCL
jgi:hypothetical protein